MPLSITDDTVEPIVVYSGASSMPFQAITVADPVTSGSGTLQVTLSAADGTSDPGSLASTVPGASFDSATHTLVVPVSLAASASYNPSSALFNISYTPPALSTGTAEVVNATLSYTHVGGDSISDGTPIQLEVVGSAPPVIAGTVARTQTTVPGTTITPFAGLTVTQPSTTPAVPEVVTVRLGTPGPLNPYPFIPFTTPLGTITDPDGGGIFNATTNIFSETVAYTPGQPDPAQAVINRLVYTPPPLADGTGLDMSMGVSVNGSDKSNGTPYLSYANPGFTLSVLDFARPSITPAQPVSAAAGQTVAPFPAVAVSDDRNIFLRGSISAAVQIILTDNGTPTDADGSLSGPGLTKIGTGTYQLATGGAYPIGMELQQLQFATSAVPANQSRTDLFSVTVTDSNPGSILNSGLSTTAVAGTVTTYGPDIADATPVTIGAGPDALGVQISEDAYQGNAQFTLAIDGVQQGGVQTATAGHAAGQTQDFTFLGDFGAGPHTATVTFLNDNGGWGPTDRNLYVDGITYDGAAVPADTATLYASGPASFAIPATGPDTLVIGLAEDAYEGDAQAAISLDGVTLGTPTVTFLNAAGAVQDFTYTGDFGGAAAAHTLAVSFLNDNGGYGPTDRNLYVKSLSFDGTMLPDSSTLYSTGTVTTSFQNNEVAAPFPPRD